MVKSGEEWVKSSEKLFTYVMYCVSVLYVGRVKSEELIAIFLPTVLLLKYEKGCLANCYTGTAD